MTVQIKKITPEDKDAVLNIVQTYWGSEVIIAHNDIFHTSELKGMKAVEDDEITGILHYRLQDDECEILTLASTRKNRGVGTALIAEVEKIARKNGCTLLSLITTNDNLNALGFYQRRGFHLVALFPGQIAKTRQLKPGIPMIGMDNIPIRDELRLEKILE